MSPYLFEDDSHAALRVQVRKWATEYVAPNADKWETAESFPRALHREAAAAGILGIGYPERFGGQGGDLSHKLVAAEELVVSGTSVGTAVGLGSHAIVLPLVLAVGTEAQKRALVPRILSGEWVAALAVTEPDAGSDVAAIRTRATREGQGFRLSGRKTFITSGARADVVLVLARSGETSGVLSAHLVPSTTPGFRVERTLGKMGWAASDTAELVFEDCALPLDSLVGDEGAGFFALMQNFAEERLLLAAQCVAISELALAEAARHLRDRHAFGKPLAGFQVLRHKLAEMATRTASARAFVGDATVRHLRSGAPPSLFAMVKNTATDACSFVVDEAVQIFGGSGYMRGTLVERLYRDARLYPIGGGTREIMNEIISKEWASS